MGSCILPRSIWILHLQLHAAARAVIWQCKWQYCSPLFVSHCSRCCAA